MKATFVISCLLALAQAFPQEIQPRQEVQPRTTCAKVPSWMKSALSDRIVGGKNADSAIPWQVSLRNANTGEYHFCGGTILSANTILTAAHCFPNGHQGIVVAAGAHKRSSNANVQLSTISKLITTNPAWNKDTMDSDIVILKLAKSLTFNKNVQPACLPDASFSPDTSKKPAVVSGWGTTKEGGKLPDILQYVKVPLMSNADCKKTGYGSDQILDSMVCAGYPKGAKDSCQGDSGGPLVVPKSATDDTAIIFGVVSFGSGCAKPNFPGVYARVGKFLDWIKKGMADGSGSAPAPAPAPAPTTAAPTTAAPTTAAPTTLAPTTAAPTSAPTTTGSDYPEYGNWPNNGDYPNYGNYPNYP